MLPRNKMDLSLYGVKQSLLPQSHNRSRNCYIIDMCSGRMYGTNHIYCRSPVSITSASDYAHRLSRSRPTAKPTVVGFSSDTLSSANLRTLDGWSGSSSLREKANYSQKYFPPAKFKCTTTNSHQPAPVKPKTKKKKKLHKVTTPVNLELAPSIDTSRRLSSSKSAPIHNEALYSKYAIYPPVYPHILQDGATLEQLTDLPKPKMLLSRGELPWVYSYKVKRNMNELSKIMASKVTPDVECPSL